MVIAFIDDHRERFGVEPICRVLSEHSCKIAPSTFYAAKTRSLSQRARRDAEVLEHVRRVHSSPLIGRRRYGARKVFNELLREQRRGEHPDLGHVPRCQVERLMRADGLRGVRRGRQFVTTRPDTGAARPADLVKRDFTAPAPNRLWVVDFTYVATWAGMVYTAFVIDVFSRRIVGWRTAATMPTALPLDALEMALWTREQADQLIDGLVHHSDAGSQSPRSSTRTGSSTSALSPRSAASVTRMTTRSPNRPSGSTRRPWRNVDDVELATLNWVWWFNEIRLHSAIGYIPPAEYEQSYYRSHNNPQEHPLSGEPALH